MRLLIALISILFCCSKALSRTTIDTFNPAPISESYQRTMKQLVDKVRKIQSEQIETLQKVQQDNIFQNLLAQRTQQIVSKHNIEAQRQKQLLETMKYQNNRLVAIQRLNQLKYSQEFYECLWNRRIMERYLGFKLYHARERIRQLRAAIIQDKEYQIHMKHKNENIQKSELSRQQMLQKCLVRERKIANRLKHQLKNMKRYTNKLEKRLHILERRDEQMKFIINYERKRQKILRERLLDATNQKLAALDMAKSASSEADACHDAVKRLRDRLNKLKHANFNINPSIDNNHIISMDSRALNTSIKCFGSLTIGFRKMNNGKYAVSVNGKEQDTPFCVDEHTKLTMMREIYKSLGYYHYHPQQKSLNAAAQTAPFVVDIVSGVYYTHNSSECLKNPISIFRGFNDIILSSESVGAIQAFPNLQRSLMNLYLQKFYNHLFKINSSTLFFNDGWRLEAPGMPLTFFFIKKCPKGLLAFGGSKKFIAGVDTSK